MNNIEGFKDVWNYEDALCTVINDDLFFASCVE